MDLKTHFLVEKWGVENLHPTSSNLLTFLKGFPNTPSSLESLVWYEFWLRTVTHPLPLQSEDVILKMYFRGEISEAKEEEEETSFDVCYKVSPVVIVFTRDLLNLGVIEVELKAAASRRQRQWKGLLHHPSSVQTFLETIGRLLFTFCHAVFYSKDTPERTAALLCETNPFFTCRIQHCGWVNNALPCTNQSGHRLFACRSHASTKRVVACSARLWQEWEPCNYFPADCH